MLGGSFLLLSDEVLAAFLVQFLLLSGIDSLGVGGHCSAASLAQFRCISGAVFSTFRSISVKFWHTLITKTPSPRCRRFLHFWCSGQRRIGANFYRASCLQMRRQNLVKLVLEFAITISRLFPWILCVFLFPPFGLALYRQPLSQRQSLGDEQ